MTSLVTIPEKTEEELQYKFPQPRTGSSIAVLNYCMYVWGGHTQFLFKAGVDECCPIDDVLPNSDENFMDVYNILSRTWEQYNTSGDIPNIGDGSTMVGSGKSLYLFGGCNDGIYSGDMYRFDTDSKVWSLVELSDGGAVKPSPRYRMDSVLYQESMCMFGGAGPLSTSLQPGAQYISIQRYNRDLLYGWNNEMFLFDFNKGCWSDIQLDDPLNRPPCASFTFNMVSSYQAILFGGNQQVGNVSDVYFFDFKQKAWSKPFKQSLPEQAWPAARSLHTACSLLDPHEVESPSHCMPYADQQLLVVWGKGQDTKHCNDIWILNTVTMQWKEVALNLRSRMWHMAASCYLDGKTEALVFGGNIRRSSKYDRHAVTDLTILTFGVLSLKESCLEVIRGNKASLLPLLNLVPVKIKDMIIKHLKSVVL